VEEGAVTLLHELLHQTYTGVTGFLPAYRKVHLYERRRNVARAARVREHARVRPPAAAGTGLQQLFGALLGNQEQNDRFLGTFAGTVASSDFVAPENIARILGRVHEPAQLVQT